MSNSLIDPNNTNAIANISPLNLTKVFNEGTLAGLRLEMGMDEVVTVFGRPMEVAVGDSGINDHGYCRTAFFKYPGLRVEFGPVTNAVQEIALDLRQLKLDGGLNGRSGTNQFIQILGKPEQIVDIHGRFLHFMYKRERWTPTLIFVVEDDESPTLFMVQLERARKFPVRFR